VQDRTGKVSGLVQQPVPQKQGIVPLRGTGPSIHGRTNDMIYESRMLCGAEIWGMEWGRKHWKGCRGGLFEKINKNP